MEFLLPGLLFAPNLHPMMVHFPIAFWLAASGAWAVGLVRRNDASWRFGIWLHTLGFTGATLAVAFGFWASAQMGHGSPGHDLVHVHRNFMLVATAISALITVVSWWKRDADGRWRFILSAMSVVLVVVMTIGADRGAELVFRYGVGVANDPPPHAMHEHDGQSHNAQLPKPFTPTSPAPESGYITSPSHTATQHKEDLDQGDGHHHDDFKHEH